MARINIEDQLFTDGRFKVFSQGKDEALAIGQMVILWRLAQTYWLPEKKNVPKNVLKSLNFYEDLIKSDLIEEKNDGFYVRGSENQFNWWFSKQNNGKKGGRPRKKEPIQKLKKANEKLPLTDSKANEKLNESYKNPQSTIYNLQSQSQSTINNNNPLPPKTCSELKFESVVEVWNASCEKYGCAKTESTAIRKRKFKPLAKEIPDIDDWKSIMTEAVDSIFTGKDGKVWKPTIDYILRPGKARELLDKFNNYQVGTSGI